METTIVTANVIRNAETGTRVINLATSEEFDFLDRANAFAHGKRKMLNISMKQFMHFINEANSDIADDVAFTLMATDPTDAQIEDILMGAKVDIEQTSVVLVNSTLMAMVRMLLLLMILFILASLICSVFLLLVGLP